MVIYFCNRRAILGKRNNCCFPWQNLLQARGLSYQYSKFDPYINVDPPGNIKPYAEHGECFVTEDGAETDLLDLGHYERFLNIYTSWQIMCNNRSHLSNCN